MHKIELHIFTNSTSSAPSTKLIKHTFDSFLSIFKNPLQTTVWCDVNPHIESANQYITNLNKVFSAVNQTSSLSDGYSRAVKESNSDFLFMLEHDWNFNHNITHSLTEILEVMSEDDILHLRFNKRSNIGKKFDRGLAEAKNKKMPYCITPGISNNPHIINRKKYVELALPLITIREKSFGIEKELSNSELTGAIYGPINYPNTISHIDGKNFRE